MALSDIDLEKRAEQTAPLSSAQHDSNCAKIEAAVAALNAAVNPLLQYGEMYQAGNTNATTLSTGTFVLVGNFTGDHLDGVTFASNALTLPAGDWFVSVSASFSGGTSDVLQFGIGVAGTVDPHHLCEQKLQNTDIQTVSLSALIVTTAGQTVDLRVNRVSGGSNATIKHATVVVHRKE